MGIRTNTLLLAGVVAFTPMALADAEAEIKYRQGVFKAVGGQMASMGAILKGQVQMDKFVVHASGMAALADVVPEIFPASSGDGKTEALPAIWENPDDFQTKVDEFVIAAKAIGEVGGSGDMSLIGPAMNRLGGTCKGCHDDYKADD